VTVAALALAAALAAPARAFGPARAVPAAPPARPERAHLPPDVELVAAWRAGDRDVALRAADRLGSEHLAALLGGADAAGARAVLWIAPEVDSAWTLLPALLALAEGPERRLALAACTAARAAGEASAGPPVGWAVEPEPAIAAAAARLAALAADRGAYPDVRVAALASGLALDAAGRPSAPERAELFDALLADPDPEVRRAAAELAPAGLPVLLTVLGDPDPAVARAAAATVAAAAATPGAQATALAPVLAAAAAWASDARLAPAARAAALRILWAGGGDGARALIAALGADKATPPAVRATAAALLKKWKKPGKK